MDPFSSASSKLTLLAHDYALPTSMNEATTRLHIIDRLLMECLGWDHSDIECEMHHSGEYNDYSIGKPSVEMIWEAKKEGLPFTLPDGITGRRVIDLSTALTDKLTKDTILQVTKYCQDRGVPIGVICNGHQLLAFYASRQDGVPPMDGRCLCFSSLEEMAGDFRTLWSHLSRDGVSSRNLQRALLGRTFKVVVPDKLSNRIQNYPGFRVRSSLETNLKLLAGLFLQDLENEPSVSDDFLNDCYVDSGALAQYAMVGKEILQTRYDSLRQTAEVDLEPITTKIGTSKYFVTRCNGCRDEPQTNHHDR